MYRIVSLTLFSPNILTEYRNKNLSFVVVVVVVFWWGNMNCYNLFMIVSFKETYRITQMSR